MAKTTDQDPKTSVSNREAPSDEKTKDAPDATEPSDDGGKEQAKEEDEQPPEPPEEMQSDKAKQPFGLDEEDLENARRRYLLRRWWLSAKGFWGRNGDRLAWPLSIGLLIL